MRLRWAVAALACLGVAAWMLTLLRDNVVYLEPVSEAVADQDSGRLRIGGSVVPGTIVEDREAGSVSFQLTEGGKVMTVQHKGSPPDLFADCAPAVVEGKWAGDVFQSDRLLIRHGNEYEPPSDDPKYACPEVRQ